MRRFVVLAARLPLRRAAERSSVPTATRNQSITCRRRESAANLRASLLRAPSARVLGYGSATPQVLALLASRPDVIRLGSA
ncbi:hypothetical protein [Nocardia sp. R6R-6]|uniref:hypothetical protein n=1 Tax=Nocardia sp. R6R-6 TaxID=3459303 RepID=UPI00403D8253